MSSIIQPRKVAAIILAAAIGSVGFVAQTSMASARSLFPEILNQYGSPVGYYGAGGRIITNNGRLPNGCSTVYGYQSANGAVSMNYSHGARQVHVASC